MRGGQLLLGTMSIWQRMWCTVTHHTYVVRRIRTNDGPWRGRDDNLPLSFYVPLGLVITIPLHSAELLCCVL